MTARKRFLGFAVLAALLCHPASLCARTLNVAKSGADYATITAAVKAASPGDVIKILDAEIYEEQVTIE